MRSLVPADARDTRDLHWCPLPLDQGPELADGATSYRGLGVSVNLSSYVFFEKWKKCRKVQRIINQILIFPPPRINNC